MKRVSAVLADYVIRKGVIEESDRDMYEYGFTVALEIGLFAIFCVFMALCLRMPTEGLLFLIIFAPLRSYAGGLHLERFWSCFALSCFTYSVALMAVKYIQVPAVFSFATLVALEAAVYSLYPVEHVNRDVDEDENRYFRAKLLKFLFVDFIIGLICLTFKSKIYLFEVTTILFIVVITMVIGKCKNMRSGMCSKDT